MLSIEDTAELLQVSERSIRRWISAGELPEHRLGRQWRISRSDLEEHLRRRRNGGDLQFL
jgi:excisionase family DNA binding protein